MNRQMITLTEEVKYNNQTYDDFLPNATTNQLLVSSATARNGSQAENDVGIFHKVCSGHVTSGASGNHYVLQSTEKYNMVCLYLTTADTSGVTFTYEYYNGSWTNLTLLNTPSLVSTGKKAILFAAPQDWTVDGSGYYSIRIYASGAPNYVMGGVKYARQLVYGKNILPGQSIYYSSEQPLLLQSGESLIGFFTYSDSSNSMKAVYRFNP